MTTAVSRASIAASYGYGLLVAACLGWFLLGLPIQLTDSFGNMLQLDTGWGEMLRAQFSSRAYLRPFLWAELKLVYDAAGGNYIPWFRAVHVLQAFAAVLLYLGLVRPLSWRDAAVVPLALAALIGGHTFQGTIVEAFPINTFMTVVLCCLAAANLSLAAHRWWVDMLALALFVVAALTVESGLLVWVVVAAAFLAGARGVSSRGVGAMTILFAGYFVLRFTILDVGSPGLEERSAAFGTRTLDPPELIARFGSNPLAFYAYNVLASLLSVVIGEPQSGLFELTRGILRGDRILPSVITVVIVSLGSGVIAAYIWRRRREWLGRRLDRHDQIVFVFLGALAANSVISYPYTKDVVMSPAGALYAAALYVAVRHVLVDGLLEGRRRALVASAVLSLVLAAGWMVRDVGAHLNVRLAGLKMRNEWVFAEGWLAGEGVVLNDADARLLRYLKNAAIMEHARDPLQPLVGLGVFDLD